jgi:hypothetical protein
MALAKRCAAASDWPELLKVTSKIPLRASRLLLMRAVAAIELQDEAAIASTVSMCLADGADPRIAVSVASRLLGDHRFAEAWRILKSIDGGDKRDIGRLLNRLAMKSDIRELRVAARARLRELGGAEPRPEPVESDDGELQLAHLASDYAFQPARSGTEDSGRAFQLSLVNGGRVATLHEDAYQKATSVFTAMIENRPEPRVFSYDDVFVNSVGQIWRADGTVLSSKQRPLPENWMRPGIESVDEAVLCTDSTRGLYHWYAERLPALAWRLADGAATMPILFGRHAAPFQDETLRLLGVPSEQVMRIDEVVHCRRVLVSLAPLASLLQWSRFGFIYDRLAAAAAAEQRGAKSPNYIYISRRDSNRRPLVNEVEIEEGLARLGVVPMLFSEMSLAAQIDAVSQARCVIAPHGAGLSHILAHRPGLRVLEIHPVQTGSYFLRLTMARLSRIRGHDHTMWLEPVNPLTRSWSADAQGFLALAASVLESLEATAGAVPPPGSFIRSPL